MQHGHHLHIDTIEVYGESSSTDGSSVELFIQLIHKPSGRVVRCRQFSGAGVVEVMKRHGVTVFEALKGLRWIEGRKVPVGKLASGRVACGKRTPETQNEETKVHNG